MIFTARCDVCPNRDATWHVTFVQRTRDSAVPSHRVECRECEKAAREEAARQPEPSLRDQVLRWAGLPDVSGTAA